MRVTIAVLAVLIVAGCDTPVPDSGAGFQSYPDYMRQQQAGGAAAIGVAPVSSQPLGASQPANRPRADTIAGIARQTGELIHQPGISDEQDFDAVASRESIESDRERLEQNRAQYVVIQPGELPQRTGPAGPNIVEFALNTRHNPGTAMYRRSAIRFTNPQRACAAFTTADLAQEAFLAAGGPERDPKGLDPDGDGFACYWDPRPFRQALR